MKFDKFMEHCFRVLCVVTAFVVFVGAVVSCTARPVTAHAAMDPTLLIDIGDYVEGYTDNLQVIEEAVIEDLRNGNIDATTEVGKQILAAVALQKIYRMDDPLLQIGGTILFDTELENTWESLGDTYNISIYGGSGVCYKTGDGTRQHFVTLSNGNATCATSDFFTLTVKPQSPFTLGVNSSYPFGVRVASKPWNSSIQLVDEMGYLTNSTDPGYGGSANFNVAMYRSVDTSQIPTVISGYAVSEYLGTSSYTRPCCGQGTSITIESTEVDKYEPWDYYNSVVKNYIEENYSDVTNNYFVFPDGYQPDTDPTEPDYLPILPPSGDVTLPPAIVPGSPELISVDGTDVEVFAPVIGQLNIDGVDIMLLAGAAGAVGVGGVAGAMINGDFFAVPIGGLDVNGHLVSIDPDGLIDFDGIQFRFDPDGHLVIDDIPYNLPVGTPNTLPSEMYEYEYQYQIPTVERIKIVDAELQTPELEEFAATTNFLWSAITRVLTDSGMMPFVICSISITAVGFILWKVGR